MFVSDSISINEKGNLTLGGADTVELAERFGTPLYAFDENEIRNTVKSAMNNANQNRFYGCTVFKDLDVCVKGCPIHK